MAQNELLKIIEDAEKEKATELDLAERGITSLPPEIGRLTKLTKLDLRDNQLTSIPKELANLSQLQTLYVDNNRFSAFPEALEGLRNIKSFGIDAKHIPALVEKVVKFPKLRSLFLDRQDLVSIPPELCQLTNLKVLTLDSNQLTSVPAELAQLTNLTELYLSRNQLTSVPPELAQLTNLMILSLSGNQLTSVPAELGQLTKLKSLTLHDNDDLTSPPPEVVKQGTKAILAYLREQLKESTTSSRQSVPGRNKGKGKGGTMNATIDPREIVPEFEKRLGCKLGRTSRRIVKEAWKLTNGASPKSPRFTTGWLVLAIVVCGRRARVRNTAKFLYERVKEKEREVRESYRVAVRKAGPVSRVNRGFDHTNYVSRTMKRATQIAIETTNDPTISLRHLFAGLLLYESKRRRTGAHKRLREMGADIDELRAQFLVFLKEAQLKDDIAAWTRILMAQESPKDLESPKQRVDVVGSVATIQIEGIGEKDRLGRDKLVKTLAGMFAQTKCDNGFTMALLGDWGQGKSTVMGLLEKELNRKHKGEFEFSKYNAWEYENAENIAAGMAQEVVSGIIDRTRFWERQKLRFYFALLEYGKNIRRVMLYIVIAVLLLWVVGEVGGDSTLKDYGVATGWVALFIFVLVNIAKIIEHPISVKLEAYLSLPNYRKHLGLVPVLRRHINTLCSLRLRQAGMRLKRRWLAKLWKSASRIASSRRKMLFGFRLLGKLGKRILRRLWLRVKGEPVRIRQLVLFVDDLDRCNVGHIVKVLDAIRLVMTIPNVIVMIGIDHRIAFKAIGKHYEELADGDDRRGEGEIARDYLGKIIQLPLRLKAASYVELKDYVFEKLFDEKNIVDDTGPGKPTKTTDPDKKTHGKVTDELKEPGPHDEHSSEEPGSVSGEDGDTGETSGGEKSTEAETTGSDEEIAEAIKDKAIERNEFYKLAGKFDFSNPRQLLRLQNSFRFLKGYGRAKGEEYDTIDILKMLFWQEFLHNWPVNIRGECMAALIDEAHGEEVKPIVKGVLDKVRDDIVQLFNGVDYAELAEFVRIVVLPHNEEGIFDTKEEIDEWLKKRKEKEEEARNEIVRVQLVENPDELPK